MGSIETELTKAWRRGDLAALARLGCQVSAGICVPITPEGVPVAATIETFPEPQKHFVKTRVMSSKDGGLTIIVPTATKSEANQRDTFGKAKRTKSARRILCQTMRPHHALLTAFVQAIEDGKALNVKLTRLGGRELDDDNLRSACKASRDAVASLLLSDDRDPWLRWDYGQEPGGPCGVRVEISVFGE